ncbi:MAG: hypothetical protein RL265_1437, partial [Bacteroidota bacterium]
AIAFENLVTTFIENVNIVQKRANLKV